MKKLMLAAFILALIIVLGFISFTTYVYNRDVPVLNTEGVSDYYIDMIKDQAGHIYSGNLPLVTWYINIDGHQDNQYDYTIYYWPFGTEEMTYLDGDGFSIEKKLH